MPLTQKASPVEVSGEEVVEREAREERGKRVGREREGIGEEGEEEGRRGGREKEKRETRRQKKERGEGPGGRGGGRGGRRKEARAREGGEERREQ